MIKNNLIQFFTLNPKGQKVCVALCNIHNYSSDLNQTKEEFAVKQTIQFWKEKVRTHNINTAIEPVRLIAIKNAKLEMEDL